MKLPPFEYARPATVEEAIALVAAAEGDAKILAGGQTLLPVMAFRLAAPRLLVDIGRIAELKGIRIADGGVTLGAMVRWCDILDDRRLATAQPLLQHAIGHVAHYQIRNRGTVGGSLAHCDNASEMPGVAVACDAQVVVRGPQGERVLAAADFVLGTLSTALAEDEVITEVRFPPWKPTRRWGFEEFSRRRGDFAMAAVTLHYDCDADGRLADVHLAVMGACSRAQRVAGAEAALQGKPPGREAAAAAGLAAAGSVDAPDNLHGSAEYRKALVAVLAERCLDAAEARPR